jgi:hypothetical protein
LLFAEPLPESETRLRRAAAECEAAIRFQSCRRDLPFDVALGFAPSRAKLREVHRLAFAKDVPYNVALVELAEGPRITVNVVGARNEELHHRHPGRGGARRCHRRDQPTEIRKASAASQAAGESARP